jgi:hypothetical protein
MLTREEKSILCLAVCLSKNMPSEKMLPTFIRMNKQILGIDEDTTREIAGDCISFVKSDITPFLQSEIKTLDATTPYI